MNRIFFLGTVALCVAGCSGSKGTSAEDPEVRSLKSQLADYTLVENDYSNQPTAHTGKPNLNALYDQYRLIESERPKVAMDKLKSLNSDPRSGPMEWGKIREEVRSRRTQLALLNEIAGDGEVSVRHSTVLPQKRGNIEATVLRLGERLICLDALDKYRNTSRLEGLKALMQVGAIHRQLYNSSHGYMTSWLDDCERRLLLCIQTMLMDGKPLSARERAQIKSIADSLGQVPLPGQTIVYQTLEAEPLCESPQQVVASFREMPNRPQLQRSLPFGLPDPDALKRRLWQETIPLIRISETAATDWKKAKKESDARIARLGSMTDNEYLVAKLVFREQWVELLEPYANRVVVRDILKLVSLGRKPDIIPTDPFSGKPYRMVQTTNGWLIYSFGADQKDDNGLLLPKKLNGSSDVVHNYDLGLMSGKRKADSKVKA